MTEIVLIESDAEALAHGFEVDDEDQRRVRRDVGRLAGLPIGEVRRDDELAAAAYLHAGEASEA